MRNRLATVFVLCAVAAGAAAFAWPNQLVPRAARYEYGCFSGLSGSSVGWGDGDSGAAEIDECGQGLG